MFARMLNILFMNTETYNTIIERPIRDLINMGKYRNLYLVLLTLMAIGVGSRYNVNGAEPVTIWAGESTRHAVALTFDDGPYPLYTPKILALLKQYQAHATFFVLGRKVEKYPGLVLAGC